MHSSKVFLKISWSILLVIFSGTILYSQGDSKPVPVRIMFYNVENLFDTFNDPDKNDDEFLPSGLRRWNQSRYNKKLNSVYKTIMAAGEWTPPAIVGFCEIENRKVLEDLIYGTYLTNYNYGIIHEESPDERGIDACLIFRKDIVHVLDHRSLTPSSIKKEDFKTRSVLYVKCEIFNDTIHLFLNHWPSRRGGVLAGESLRTVIAGMVRSAADSLGRINSGHSRIVIMGDFNCTPDDPVIQKVTERIEPFIPGKSLSLVNLTALEKSSNQGTYRYMGAWEFLDQIIVSDWLLNCSEGLSTDAKKFRVFRPDFLLKNDLGYPGLTTFNTYRGYRYQGGFSDHLPVLLDLFVR